MYSTVFSFETGGSEECFLNTNIHFEVLHVYYNKKWVHFVLQNFRANLGEGGWESRPIWLKANILKKTNY